MEDLDAGHSKISPLLVFFTGWGLCLRDWAPGGRGGVWLLIVQGPVGGSRSPLIALVCVAGTCW